MRAAILEERRKERARWVQKRTAPSNRQLARDWDEDESTTSHWGTDRVESGPIYRDFDAVYRSADGQRTDPMPELIEIEAIVLERWLEKRTDDDLVGMWHELRHAEHDHEAAENRASQGYVDRELCRRAAKEEARTQIVWAAVDELLEQREINPTDAEWLR